MTQCYINSLRLTAKVYGEYRRASIDQIVSVLDLSRLKGRVQSGVIAFEPHKNLLDQATVGRRGDSVQVAPQSPSPEDRTDIRLTVNFNYPMTQGGLPVADAMKEMARLTKRLEQALSSKIEVVYPVQASMTKRMDRNDWTVESSLYSNPSVEMTPYFGKDLAFLSLPTAIYPGGEEKTIPLFSEDPAQIAPRLEKASVRIRRGERTARIRRESAEEFIWKVEYPLLTLTHEQAFDVLEWNVPDLNDVQLEEFLLLTYRWMKVEQPVIFRPTITLWDAEHMMRTTAKYLVWGEAYILPL